MLLNSSADFSYLSLCAVTAFHRGEGVWGFGKDAEIERPKALQDAKPTKRSYRDGEFALFYKKQTFSKS